MQAGTRVRIPWQTNHDIPTWNQKCAWAVETFGLPGDKFDTHATEDYMDFFTVQCSINSFGDIGQFTGLKPNQT